MSQDNAIDAFSYKIWTMPNDYRTKGVQLIQNVVKSRLVTYVEPRENYDESSIYFKKGKTKQTQKERDQKQPSDKRTKATEEQEPEEESTRKRLVTFSQDYPDTPHCGSRGEGRSRR